MYLGGYFRRNSLPRQEGKRRILPQMNKLGQKKVRQPRPTKLGIRLRRAREEYARQIGREVKVEDIADALKERGVQIERRTYNNLETGRTKTIKPEVANALPSILPITVLDIVEALGFVVRLGKTEVEAGAVLLRAFLNTQGDDRLIAQVSLGLGSELSSEGPIGSLRRLATMDRRDHQGSPE